jgi:hypothetical protein
MVTDLVEGGLSAMPSWAVIRTLDTTPPLALEAIPVLSAPRVMLESVNEGLPNRK